MDVDLVMTVDVLRLASLETSSQNLYRQRRRAVGVIRIVWLLIGVVFAIGAIVVRTGPMRKKVNTWDAETGGGKDELPDPAL